MIQAARPDGAPAARQVQSPTLPAGDGRAHLAGEIGRALNGTGVRGSEGPRSVAGAGEVGQPGAARSAERPGVRGRPAPSRPAPSAGAKQSAQRAEVKEETTFERIIRNMRLKAGERRSNAKMWLDPPELGRMTVNVRMEGDALTVDVRTENTEARDLLYERVAKLRSALLEHGIDINRFEVTVDGDAAQPESREFGGSPTGRQENMGQRETSAKDRKDEKAEPRHHAVTGTDEEVMTVGDRRIDVRI
jgi:flagellar hook-length control protein FliK